MQIPLILYLLSVETEPTVRLLIQRSCKLTS